MSNQNNKEFKALQKHWYKKLKTEGFDDIEQDETKLKSWSHQITKQYIENPQYCHSKKLYYQMASQFLHDHKFENEVERVIWAYHCEGISIRDISTLLRKVRIKMARSPIGRILKKLKDEMIKTYGTATTND